MAVIKISDKAQRIITNVLTILATIFLGVSKILGWDIPEYGTIINIVVIIVAAIFGIDWVPPMPKKPSNDTGGNG